MLNWLCSLKGLGKDRSKIANAWMNLLCLTKEKEGLEIKIIYRGVNKEGQPLEEFLRENQYIALQGTADDILESVLHLIK